MLYSYQNLMENSSINMPENGKGLKLENLIKNLKCMMGVNKSCVPKFKYVQFKKS